MPAATYFKAIHISGAIAASASTGGGGGSVTIYTVPANSYAIFQWTVTSIVGPNYVRLTVGGNVVANKLALYDNVIGVYAGPGQTIVHSGDGAGGSVISGVLFET